MLPLSSMYSWEEGTDVSEKTVCGYGCLGGSPLLLGIIIPAFATVRLRGLERESQVLLAFLLGSLPSVFALEKGEAPARSQQTWCSAGGQCVSAGVGQGLRSFLNQEGGTGIVLRAFLALNPAISFSIGLSQASLNFMANMNMLS